MAITREDAKTITSGRTLVRQYRERFTSSLVSKTKDYEQECLTDATILEEEIIARLEAGARAVETSAKTPGYDIDTAPRPPIELMMESLALPEEIDK